jgi:hypothetical protein
MVSAATLETDEEPDFYNDDDIEPDFYPISAATVNPVGINEQEPEEHFSDEEEIVQTPPVDPDSEPETNPSTDAKNTFYPFPDEKFFLLYCYSHGIIRPKVRK